MREPERAIDYEWHVDPFLDAIRAETQRLATAVDERPDGAVPSCPGWTVARVAGHTGRVHDWVATVVERRADGPDVGERARPPATDELHDWLVAGAERLVGVLDAVGPDEPQWNWLQGADGLAGWWRRRMAVETAVHRVDAELGAGLPVAPVDPDVAAAGLDELLCELLPARGAGSLRGSVHVHRTDGEGEWLVRLDGGAPVVTREHAKGDLAVRGSASDLLRLLWNRPVDGVEVFGDERLVAAWAEQVRL